MGEGSRPDLKSPARNSRDFCIYRDMSMRAKIKKFLFFKFSLKKVLGIIALCLVCFIAGICSYESSYDELPIKIEKSYVDFYKQARHYLDTNEIFSTVNYWCYRAESKNDTVYLGFIGGDDLERRDRYAWGILEGEISYFNRDLITFAFYNNELVMITQQCDSFECWDKPCESPAWLYCK